MALEVFCLASQRVSKIWVWSPGKPSSLVYQISHHFRQPLAQPLALTLYPQDISLRPCFRLLGLLELSVLCYKKLPQMRVSFFFSVSASNRVNVKLQLAAMFYIKPRMEHEEGKRLRFVLKKLWRRRCQIRNGISCLKILGRGTTHWAPSTQQSLLVRNENLLAYNMLSPPWSQHCSRVLERGDWRRP